MTLRVVAILLLGVTLAPAAPVVAGGPTARALYSRALERERALRDAEQNATLEQLRRAVDAYEALVRRFPASGYSDNALWQGGNLALLAFERFGQAADKRTATRLLTDLRDHYSSSSLVARATDVLAHADAMRPVTALRPLKPLSRVESAASWPASLQPEAVSRSSETAGRPADGGSQVLDSGNRKAEVPVEPAADAAVATASGPVMIRGIKRTAIENGVRVTIEMDGESTYRAERLERPRRVFFDLKGTRPIPPLQDATLRFGGDLVPEVRLGRHPQNTTRIVFDMRGVDSYSVFTLYNPFRMVIDFKTTQTATVGHIPPARRTADIAQKGLSAPPEPSPVALVASLPPPVLTPPTPAKTAREAAEPPARPLASRPVLSPSPIPPAVPAANSDGKFSLARQLGLGVSRIVIDAGHGGHDPGAQSTGINESELTLDVAMRLSRLLQKQPGVEVVMTRDTDVFVPLEERTAIANREGADLFLSIHANASRNAKARGVETYFLNFASNPDAAAVAARENSASARAMHSLPDIVRAIALNNKIDESRDFADMVQRSMVRRLSARNSQLRDLGVKQAPFVVLIGAAMPSVLAEISFVTHKQEGQLLKTGAYRQQIAEALFDAVLRYQQSLKKLKTGPIGMGAR